ncbi:MAG: branched-chain amino acid ABC transporter permease [Candidatus Hodarchaeales archaeon]
MAIFPVDLLQNISLALVYAAGLIMLTVGLNMVYSVMKFSNFSHAEWVTLGMFMSWWMLQILSFVIPWDSNYIINNIFVQAAFAFLVVGILGILSEFLIFGRLKRVKASPRSFTVASIGIGLVVRNLLAMFFDQGFPQAKQSMDGIVIDCPECTDVANIPSFLDLSWISDILQQIGINWINIEKNLFHISIIDDPSIDYSFLPFLNPLLGRLEIRLTGFEFYIIIICLIMVFVIDYMFKYTRFGIAMRATSDSMELAQVSGINTTRIIYYTWFIAAGVTGFGAAFYRANSGSFNMYNGFYLLLPIFAVAILGGVGSFRGGIIAALIIALSRQFTNILFTQFQKTGGLEDLLLDTFGFTVTFSPNYAEAVAFLVLIIVLLIRPQGIYGSIESARARV